MAPQRRRPPPAGTGQAEPVVRILVVDADAAGHARCHLALRGLRVDRRPVQLLHARTNEDAADLLLLHDDVAVVIVGAGSVDAWHRRDDDRPLRTILQGAEAQPCDGGAIGDGEGAGGAALHAAVLAALRHAERGAVANPVLLG
jgi:hypothetical protein